MEITGKEIKKALENYLKRDISLNSVDLNGDVELIKTLNQFKINVDIQ